MPATIRSQALRKLAQLGDESDLERIAELCPPYHGYANGNGSAGRVPMVYHPRANPRFQDAFITDDTPKGHKELESILALCHAAPFVKDIRAATRLLQQLSPYVAESSYQTLTPSPFLRNLTPSPWEVLTYSLTTALLVIAKRHPDLRDDVVTVLRNYVEDCHGLSQDLDMAAPTATGAPIKHDVHDTPGIFTLTTSLLGFLKAAAERASFWSTEERFELIGSLQTLLSDRFLVSSETVFSAIRTGKTPLAFARDSRVYLKAYIAAGRPLSALLMRHAFVDLVQSCAALMVLKPVALANHDVLDALILLDKQHRLRDAYAADRIARLASQEIALLQDTMDHHAVGSTVASSLSCSTRSKALVSYLFCALVDGEAADINLLLSWLDTALEDSTRLGDEELLSTTLRCLTVVGTTSISIASDLNRSITRFLTSHALSERLSHIAARSLLHILKTLPQDTVYNALFSLGNSLTAGRQIEHVAPHFALFEQPPPDGNGFLTADASAVGGDSSTSLIPESSEASTGVHHTVITAIVDIARGFKDEKLIALAVSTLIQKVGKINMVVDSKIIKDTAILAPEGVPNDFEALLKLYSRLSHQAIAAHNGAMLHAVEEARLHLSRTLKGGSRLYAVYLEHLLTNLVSVGDTSKQERIESEITTREIGLLLKPLALLAKSNAATPGILDIDDFPVLQRDAWYNIVAHGFGSSSALLEKHGADIQTLAHYTKPLITEERASMLESDIDLNIVLRRGKSDHKVKEFRQHMIQVLPRCESDINHLDYSELVFLETVYLVESSRASTGDCTKTLVYFVEPHLKSGPLSACIEAVALTAVDRFLSKTSVGSHEEFSAPFVAQQLSHIFVQCCHRIAKVQQVAYACAQRIIERIPSALCQRSSVFTLLDLLTLMWTSCLDAESNEYEWKSEVTTPLTGTTLQLSDDYDFRRLTLRTLHARATQWVKRAINTAALDIKGLLQTYLSDYVEDEAFGHMSLGRSFALELGSVVPSTDQRLSAIEVEDDLHINTASDFMAQYTTRQEYRYTDPLRLEEGSKGLPKVNGFLPHSGPKTHLDSPSAINTGLVAVEAKISQKQVPPTDEIRDVLRRAAALLCRSTSDENTTISLFVRIPFLAFTKQSIKFGLSLWMGVIKENPRMEPRILVEIMENWIRSVRNKLGLFSNRTHLPDPFYVKEEFAPSDREWINKQQHRVHDLIAPHFRILQFLSSHYYATRLSNATVERSYHRFLKATLQGLRKTHAHPLAREAHLHIVLLALKILRNSTGITAVAQWRLKDEILSAGLAWFKFAPRWSYGGNRLQIKAEMHLLADVDAALHAVADIASENLFSRSSLLKKQELYETLLTNEQSRLAVWLFPLDHQKRNKLIAGSSQRSTSDSTVIALLPTAWREDPGLAVALHHRFHSSKLEEAIRSLILKYPQQVIDYPDGLQILLGQSLPRDLTTQLKYMLYWAPVNPITAVSYFLPAYGGHPNIIQYAVRALESHSVDVTFFYVPQIVQSLRYDDLGYVERYIVETGKSSQLFAHQIIWNMKANAYKDEDATDPDPMKPTLDKVMEHLISSFTGADKQFYEREFAFFDGVTGISGKLRPYLKKSKPEKKQKIEEELRAIQIDVGVYLPSNPDGVVVGIDRKSGKPLQSHAKTPYMATFRIRKEKDQDVEVVEEQLERVNTRGENPATEANTYEIWQSAIFKVGDDCRQDVLALQMIAAFRGIFHNVGLPLFVFPYRVTATAPGCGVIDVLPNSISRDMLGREAVNGLYEWFVSRFGGEDSLEFQQARGEFVKSMAAYSIISYFLQFKDRHNGNIMFDESGHVLHIDFGFCFDIAPGGVKFERAPFKLTKEMVAVMGGSTETQSFRWFEELCIKAFLASRQHVKPLADMVVCMLDSGLPCFKPETIKHFKERFVLEKNDREAADFVRKLVRASYANYSTKVYDQFQLMTNGIPY